MPEFRRGHAADEQSSRGSGSFKPWAPVIRWKDDGEEKYIVPIVPYDDTVRVDLHEFIPVGQREDGSKIFEFFISRRDRGIGESSDLLEDKFDFGPKDRRLGVFLELEPVMGKGRNGKPRPESFVVKTDTYERRIFDEDGEDTGETEEVTNPVVGVVSQAPGNFWTHFRSHDQAEGPIEDYAFKVRRVGDDKDTTYSVNPYEDQEIDYTGLLENVDAITYLREEADDIKREIANLDPKKAACLIGEVLLTKRLNELADGDRYNEILGGLEEIENKYPKSKRDKKPKGEKKSSRPARNTKSAPKEDSGESSGEGERMSAFKRIREAQESK